MLGCGYKHSASSRHFPNPRPLLPKCPGFYNRGVVTECDDVTRSLLRLCFFLEITEAAQQFQNWKHAQCSFSAWYSNSFVKEAELLFFPNKCCLLYSCISQFATSWVEQLKIILRNICGHSILRWSSSGVEERTKYTFMRLTWNMKIAIAY